MKKEMADTCDATSFSKQQASNMITMMETFDNACF